MSDYLWFEGITFPTAVNEKEIIEDIHNIFVMRDEDTVILTYPKSGSNWLIEIVCLIQTKGDPNWIQSVPIWDSSPWIENQNGYPLLINKEGPHLIISHLPFHIFSKSFFSSRAKTTSEYQNVKYHSVILGRYMKEGEISTRAFRNYTYRKTKFIKIPESLTTNFEWFIKGNGTTGDWKNHFTVAQAEDFDKVFQEKMAGFPPGLFPWE